MLEAEAKQLYNAGCYQRTDARRDRRAPTGRHRESFCACGLFVRKRHGALERGRRPFATGALFSGGRAMILYRHAAAPIAGKQAPSVYRYRISTMEVTVVSDGATTFPLSDTFVINVKAPTCRETR